MKFSYYQFILALEAASLVSITMPSAVNAQKSGHLRNRRSNDIASPPEYSATSTTNNDLRRLSNTQSCTLGLENVMPLLDAPHSSIKDHVFTCVMDPEEEDTTYRPGRMFDLDMDADDEEFLEKLMNDGTISLGQSKLDIQGLEYDAEKIRIPKGWGIASKISNGTKKSPPWKNNRLRHHAQDNNIYENRNLKTGDKNVLVVKVVTPEVIDPIYGNVTCAASQRPETPAEISSIIFGEGPTGIANSNVNMKDQVSACSYDKLNMFPTDGDDQINAPGVMTLDIDVSLCNHRNIIRDNAMLKLEQTLGHHPTQSYDHVLFLLEKCVQNCGWAAFAGSNSWYSFYQNANYKYPAVVMHELGHNFNLAHSGGIDGATYSDQTGFMGNPAHAPGARYAGNLCYDAAKSWQLGWYNDHDITFYPENESSTWGTVKTMVGIANYDQATSDTPVLIKLETGLAEDYFINFNRATGINEQNVEADDEVTIVKANADTKSQSYLQATLLEDESHTIVGLGKANGIVVKLLSIDKTDPDLWKAEVFIGTDQATIPGVTTPQPTTQNPSKSPTLSPSASPVTASPTKGPSKSPQLNPTTARPSMSPSVQPSKSPSRMPSKSPSKSPVTPSPTNVPTPSPTNSPSLKPTQFPTRSPVECSLAGIGQSCSTGSDCCSGLCTGGSKWSRVCYSNTPTTPAPVAPTTPAPIAQPTTQPPFTPAPVGSSCSAFKEQCSKDSDCCSGSCHHNKKTCN